MCVCVCVCADMTLYDSQREGTRERELFMQCTKPCVPIFYVPPHAHTIPSVFTNQLPVSLSSDCLQWPT